MKKRMLFIQGLRANLLKPRDNWIAPLLEDSLKEIATVKTICPDYENPIKVYEKLKEMEDSFDIAIGFSMGGFFLDFLEVPYKIYINPALAIPDVIPTQRKNTTAGKELVKLSAGKFKYKPKKILSFVSTADRLLGELPAELVKKNYPGISKIVSLEGATHIPEKIYWKEVIVPEIIKEML